MKGRAILASCLLLTTLPIRAGEPLKLRVSPSVAFAPANLIVRATVETDRDNRSIEIIAESDDFYRSSEIELEGDRAPRTNVFEFHGLPRGTYQVSAVLKGTRGPRAMMRQQVNVVAGETRNLN